MFRRRASLTFSLALTCLLFLAFLAKREARAQAGKQAPPSIQYVAAWGMKGSEPGHLDQPTCIATDALGDIFLADAGSRFIHKFDPQGTPLLSFQDDWVKSPQAIALDRGGAIYVADASRGSVSIFLPTGDRYHDLKLRSRPNAEDTLGVTVADDGLIFVLDKKAGQVFVYTQASDSHKPGTPFLLRESGPRPLLPGPTATSTCSMRTTTRSFASPKPDIWYQKLLRGRRRPAAGWVISLRFPMAMRF